MAADKKNRCVLRRAQGIVMMAMKGFGISIVLINACIRGTNLMRTFQACNYKYNYFLAY